MSQDPFSVLPQAGVASSTQVSPETAADAAGGATLPSQQESTTGRSRRKVSDAEKAKKALGVAERRVESLRKRQEKAEEDTTRLRIELQAAEAQRQYLAQHPALASDDQS